MSLMSRDVNDGLVIVEIEDSFLGGDGVLNGLVSEPPLHATVRPALVRLAPLVGAPEEASRTVDVEAIADVLARVDAHHFGFDELALPIGSEVSVEREFGHFVSLSLLS